MSARQKHNTLKDTIWVFKGKRFIKQLPEAPSFSTAKRCIVYMGLHLHQLHSKQIETYCDSLRKRGYKILQVILYPTRDPKTISSHQSSDTLHLCLKDVAFSGFPKKLILEKLQNFEADIFINFNGDFTYTDMGFALGSRAPYRVSPYQLEYKPYFNILFKSRKDESLLEYLKSINQFFKHLT